ncbi:MAG TPA: M20/M25/M40 family metallo-hydrolase [Acidobacteriota bacterium]|nr:M20/M25/M40 family metallo-hydrolase [Acidobacteriota bacterium]
MKTRHLSGFVSLLALCLLFASESSSSWIDAYKEPASRIIGAALADNFAWDRLTVLCDDFGPRLSGSQALERAIRWAVEEMKKDGLEEVRTEHVMVPHWVRGSESLEITRPLTQSLVVLGLGDSIATPPEGIECEILVVRNYDDLESNAAKVPGKIVVYNVPFTSYGQTVQYRSNGASRAAKLGAKGILLRSVGLPGLRTAHTGVLDYSAAAPKIPAAAIPAEDAERLQRMQDRGERVTVRLKMDAHFEPDAESANVVAELRGREKPEEIVVIGGHLDSWDVGTGAVDDGGGCLVTWSALRVLKNLNLRPRRTIRVVLFVNEENGLRGGMGYRDLHRGELANHVMMLESDSGVFRPLGFGISGNERARSAVRDIASLLRGIGADRISIGGGGADIGPSVQSAKIPSMSLEVDGTQYFVYHHSAADTPDKLNPMDVSLGVAAVALMAYVVADMPSRLGQ